MDLAHEMRCLMWRFSVHLESLETGLFLQYSPAHGNGAEEREQLVLERRHCNHAALWCVDLCQTTADETERAHAGGWGCTIHGAHTWSETGVSRRVLQ